MESKKSMKIMENIEEIAAIMALGFLKKILYSIDLYKDIIITLRSQPLTE